MSQGQSVNAILSLCVSDYDYDDYEDEQQEQISSTPHTKSTQLHKAETKPTQLYDAETKPTHLHKTETKPTQLHKGETKPPHLHKAETKPTHLHKAETKPTHLPKAETKPKHFHKTETKPTHLHKAETKIAPESPGPPHIRLSTSERDFKTVTIPNQARGRQQRKLERERTTTLVQPEQTQSGSFNSNSGDKNEPQNTFQEEKGNRKFVPKSKQERRETFKETPHTANDLTSQGKSSHGGDQRSECNDNEEKDPECNDAGDKHPKCNGKADRRRARNGSKQKHNLPPCHSDSPNGKDTEYMNAGSDSNHQDNEDSRVGSNKHDQQNEDTRVRSNKHDQQNEDTRVRSNKHDQHNEDSRVESNKHDQHNEDSRVGSNKHDQHKGDSRVGSSEQNQHKGDSRLGSSEQNPVGKNQQKQKVRTNGTKQQLLKSSSKNSRRTSFSTKTRPQTSTVVSPPKASSEVVESSPKAFTKPAVSPPEASTKLAGSPSNVSTKHLSRIPLNRQPGASATTTTLRNQHKSFILRKITAAVTASSPTTPEGPRKTARPTERTSSVSVSLSKGKKLFTRGSVGDFSPASEAVTVEGGVSQEEVEGGVGEEETEEGVNEEEVKEEVTEEEVEEGISQEKLDVLKPTTLRGNRSDPPSNWPSPGPRFPTGRRPADLDKEADAEPGLSPNPAPEGGVVTTLHSRAAPSSLTSTLGGRVSSITPRSYSSDKSSHPTSPSRYYDDDDKLPTVLTAVAPNRDGRGDSGGVNAPVLAENGKDPKATLAPTATLTKFSAADSESAGDRTGVRNGEHASRQSEDNKAESLSAESRPQFQSPSSTVSTRSPNSSNKQSSLASSTSPPTASKHIDQQEPVLEKAVVLEPNPAQEEDLLEPDPTQEEPNPKRHRPGVTKAVEGDKNSADKASRSSKDQNGTLSGDVKTADIADNVGLHSVQLPHVTADQRTGTDEDRPTNRETDPMDGGQYLANSGQRGPKGKELPDSLRGFAPTRLADTEETTVYKPTARPDSKRRPEKRRYDHLNTDGESGNKTERDRDVKLDIKEKLETEENPGTEVEAGTEAGLDTQPEAGREAEADGQAEADRKGEAEKEADRKAAAETEADRKAAAETEADRKAAAETEADRKAEAETEADRKAEAEWGMEQAAERKDGPGAGRPTLATSFSGQPSGGTGGGTARATPVYHSHDQAPPWGQDCSQPWKGHNWCTSIIMHARLGSPAEECRFVTSQSW